MSHRSNIPELNSGFWANAKMLCPYIGGRDRDYWRDLLARLVTKHDPAIVLKAVQRLEEEKPTPLLNRRKLTDNYNYFFRLFQGIVQDKRDAMEVARMFRPIIRA